MEAQMNQRMLANVTEEYAFRVVDKALPPDVDDTIRPRKLQLVVMGAAVGLLIGFLLVIGLRRMSAQ
jgi:LPS O-antigen subunit length determinant protein (WzzB/FepE family)